MTTWTPEADAKLRAYLDRPGYVIPRGLGTEQAACSMAAINLALTGELADHIPDCMSKVVGQWILMVQDAMPETMRNSAVWKDLLQLAAGTGRDHEQERLDIIMDWMWGTVLLCWQPRADELGFGAEWQHMCDERTGATAFAAAKAAHAAEAAGDAPARAAAKWAARAATVAELNPYGYIYGEAAWAAAMLTTAATLSAQRGTMRNAAESEAQAAVWVMFNPVGLLKRLVEVRS